MIPTEIAAARSGYELGTMPGRGRISSPSAPINARLCLTTAAFVRSWKTAGAGFPTKSTPGALFSMNGSSCPITYMASSLFWTTPVGAIVGNFKSLAARRINNLRRTPGGRVWQRGYYDRIVRNERELAAIRRYIRDNPARWAEDRENLDAALAKMQRRMGA